MIVDYRALHQIANCIQSPISSCCMGLMRKVISNWAKGDFQLVEEGLKVIGIQLQDDFVDNDELFSDFVEFLLDIINKYQDTQISNLCLWVVSILSSKKLEFITKCLVKYDCIGKIGEISDKGYSFVKVFGQIIGNLCMSRICTEYINDNHKIILDIVGFLFQKKVDSKEGIFLVKSVGHICFEFVHDLVLCLKNITEIPSKLLVELIACVINEQTISSVDSTWLEGLALTIGADDKHSLLSVILLWGRMKSLDSILYIDHQDDEISSLAVWALGEYLLRGEESVCNCLSLGVYDRLSYIWETGSYQLIKQSCICISRSITFMQNSIIETFLKNQVVETMVTIIQNDSDENTIYELICAIYELTIRQIIQPTICNIFNVANEIMSSIESPRVIIIANLLIDFCES